MMLHLARQCGCSIQAGGNSLYLGQASWLRSLLFVVHPLGGFQAWGLSVGITANAVSQRGVKLIRGFNRAALCLFSRHQIMIQRFGGRKPTLFAVIVRPLHVE